MNQSQIVQEKQEKAVSLWNGEYTTTALTWNEPMQLTGTLFLRLAVPGA